jgi:threonyl-tRNA synthetase
LGLRTEVDQRSESLNRKVRDAQLNKIPLILTCGAKEMENATVSVRTLDGQVKHGIPIAEFEQRVLDNIAQRRLNLEFGW